MWKLDYARFKNFIGIYLGTGLKDIEIDFTKAKSNIIILMGSNGCGKTSLLSNLQPFPYVSNSDVRKGTDLILKDKNGEKELKYTNNSTGNKYHLKYFYQHKSKNKTLKCFMEKTDKHGNVLELNPNGNVKSFLELLKIEFGVDESYIELVRLGSNVESLLDKKSTDRKVYMNKILSDLKVYTEYYKHVNDKWRSYRSIIKNITDKLDKLKYSDEKEIKKRIKHLEEHRKEIQKSIDESNNTVNRYKGNLDLLDPDGKIKNKYFKLSEELSIKLEEYKKIDSSLNKMLSKSNDLTNIISRNGNLSQVEISLAREIDILSNRISILKNELRELHIELDSLYREYDVKNQYVSNYKIKDYEDLLDIKKSYMKELLKYDKEYGFDKNTPTVKKDELFIGLQIVQVIKNNIDNMTDYTYTTLEKVCDMMLDEYGIKELKSDIDKVYKKIEKYNFNIDQAALKLEKYRANLKYAEILKERPKACSIDTCPFIKDALRFKNIDEKIVELENEISKNKSKLMLLHYKVVELTEYYRCYQHISDIIKLVNANKDILDKMPNNDFYIKKKKFIANLKNKKSYDDIDSFDKFINILDEYEYYRDLKENKLPLVLREIDLNKRETELLEGYQKDIDNLYNKIEIIRDKIMNKEDEMKDLPSELDNLIDIKENVIIYKDKYENKKILKEELSAIRSEYNDIKDNIEKIKDIEKRIEENERLIKFRQVELKPIIEDLSDMNYTLKEFKALNDEKEKLDSEFFEVDLIRDALSSKEGIPLIFIDLYLKSTKLECNKLLKNCFNGELKIEDFDVSSDDFNIPFSINGYINPDVSYASQGQKALINLVFSFSMIKQSISGYDILLSDELDGPLDQKHRRLFVNMVDTEMKNIGSNLCIMISHNPEYENCNVDYIVLDKNVKIKEGSNVIFTI